MENLQPDWITNGNMDAEYNRYLLLAYSQFVRKNFTENKLYPPLQEVIMHHDNMVSLKKEKEKVESSFGKSITGIDLKQLEFTYQKTKGVINHDYLDEMIDFSLTEFESLIEEGCEIYDFMESNINFDPVGILPMYKDEGYLICQNENQKTVSIFRFLVSLFQSSNEKFKSLKMDFLGTEKKSISNGFENIKLKLIKKYQDLPNPATYIVRSDLKIPFQESLLPISKRLLLKELAR